MAAFLRMHEIAELSRAIGISVSEIHAMDAIDVERLLTVFHAWNGWLRHCAGES